MDVDKLSLTDTQLMMAQKHTNKRCHEEIQGFHHVHVAGSALCGREQKLSVYWILHKPGLNTVLFILKALIIYIE